MKPGDYRAAMDRAMRFLGPRPRSRREVEGRLFSAGFEPAVCEQALVRLEELSILDDAAYAVEAARQARAKGRGPQAARRSLGEKGVPEAAIEAALFEVYEGQDEQELAVEAARARAGKLAGLSPAAQHRRLANFLAHRGFDPETVHAVCCRVLEDFARSD